MIISHGLNTKKSLGQHFLLDRNLTDRIARNAKVENKIVVEIGPGPGALTRSLLAQNVAQLIAIEKDQDCVAALGSLKTLYKDRLQILEADALAVKFDTLSSNPV